MGTGLQVVRVTRKSGASAGCDEPRLKSASSQVPGFGNVIYSAEDTDPGPCFERVRGAGNGVWKNVLFPVAERKQHDQGDRKKKSI